MPTGEFKRRFIEYSGEDEPVATREQRRRRLVGDRVELREAREGRHLVVQKKFVRRAPGRDRDGYDELFTRERR